MVETLESAWSPDEFFAWQDRQSDRFELVGGRPSPITGARKAHDDIVVNILVALGPQLHGSGWQLFTADSAVETYPGQIRRPDVGIDSGTADPGSNLAVAPVLVLEVLSPSTRDFETIAKLPEYKGAAGLNYIVFVEPNEPSVLLWSRDAAGAWAEARIAGIEARLELPALAAELEMSAIY